MDEASGGGAEVDGALGGEGRRKKRMAQRRAWAWDLEEMRSAGAALDDHDDTYATEYYFRYCHRTFTQLVLIITPGIPH